LIKNIWTITLLIMSHTLITGCSTPQRPQLTATMATIKPAITATVSDPAWDKAATINGLSPCDKRASFQDSLNPTQIKVLWDAQYLYVRFICDDDQIFTPHGSTRNGLHHEGDVTEVFIDPVGDGRQYVEVQVNPVGGVLDVMHTNTTPYRPNRTEVLPREDWPMHIGVTEWQMPGLRTAASIHTMDDGRKQWITDMAIPAKTLLRRVKTETFSTMTMRINFLRCDGPVDPATGKRSQLIASSWSHVPTGLPHLAPGTMGYITLTDK